MPPIKREPLMSSLSRDAIASGYTSRKAEVRLPVRFERGSRVLDGRVESTVLPEERKHLRALMAFLKTRGEVIFNPSGIEALLEENLGFGRDPLVLLLRHATSDGHIYRKVRNGCTVGISAPKRMEELDELDDAPANLHGKVDHHKVDRYGKEKKSREVAMLEDVDALDVES